MHYSILKKSRVLEFEIDKNHRDEKEVIIELFKTHGIKVEERQLQLRDSKLVITLELVLGEKQIDWLQDYLLENKTIISFSL